MNGVNALEFAAAVVLLAVAIAVVSSRARLTRVVVARLVKIEFASPRNDAEDPAESSDDE